MRWTGSVVVHGSFLLPVDPSDVLLKPPELELGVIVSVEFLKLNLLHRHRLGELEDGGAPDADGYVARHRSGFLFWIRFVTRSCGIVRTAALGAR